MTNGEKYKTPEDRHVNWRKFCADKDFCKKCELNEEKPTCSCIFKWLDLEAKEDLKPCPFCGGTNIEILDCVVICRNCNTDVVVTSQSKEETIKKWNRRNKND